MKTVYIAILLLCGYFAIGQTPQLVQDLNPGIEDGLSLLNSNGFYINDGFLFIANDGQVGNELFFLINDEITLYKSSLVLDKHHI